jgi:hypothetical protein
MYEKLLLANLDAPKHSAAPWGLDDAEIHPLITAVQSPYVCDGLREALQQDVNL